MEEDRQFETLLRQLQQSKRELAGVLARVWTEDRDFICDLLRGERLGIQPISQDSQDKWLLIFQRVALVEQLLDELAGDPDEAFAGLLTRHRKLARDRLFFPDMRRMTAEYEENRATLSPDCRKLLKDALADYDLAQRMCKASALDQEDRNAAWQQFEERYHKLIYYSINRYSDTRARDEHEKQDMMQDVMIEMLGAAGRYDARMAALNTYVTVIVNRVCYRFGRERMRESLPPPTAPSDDDQEGSVEPPPFPELEYLIELFHQTMAYRDTDADSIRIYWSLLELKWHEWPARAIAERLNGELNPSPLLNENAINQRWNELKKWLQEEDRRAEIFEGTLSARQISLLDQKMYRCILYLKLRGWPLHQIIQYCNHTFFQAEPLTEKTVQKHWSMLKKWMTEWVRSEDKGEGTK